MTKRYFYLFLVINSLLHWRCSKDLIGFEMSYRKDFPREIPASASTILSHNFIIDNIESNAQAFYVNNNVTDAGVLRIVPRFAKITAIFGDADFAFINRILVYVYPVGDPSKKTEVFYREDVPVNTGTFLNLNAGLSDVKSIVGTERFTVEVRIDVRGQPSRNIETRIDFGFFAVTQ